MTNEEDQLYFSSPYEYPTTYSCSIYEEWNLGGGEDFYALRNSHAFDFFEADAPY